MSKSTRLNLPFILPNQAQKHITHNEAVRELDAIVQLVLVSADLTTPPDAPSEGDCYAIASNPSNEWEGRPGDIAVWRDNSWRFITPLPGWRAFDISANSLRICNEAHEWVAYIGNSPTGGGSNGESTQLGVNATAAENQRLAVASDTSLFNHENGSHQLLINRQQSVDTASIVFQTGFSGLAEIGLVESNELQVRRSTDGDVFASAVKVSTDTGQVLIGETDIPSFDQDRFVVSHAQATAQFRIGALSTSLILASDTTRKQWQFQHRISTGAFRFVHFDGTAFSIPAEFFSDALHMNVPVQLPTYQTNTLPAPIAGRLACLGDSGSSNDLVFADGDNWRRIQVGPPI